MKRLFSKPFAAITAAQSDEFQSNGLASPTLAQELRTGKAPMIDDRADESADQNQHSIQIPTYFGGSSFTSERPLIIQG
jgi:hypothetical protein